MAYIRIWVHTVWGTKRKEAFLTGENKRKILDHIRQNAGEKGIYIDFINGHKDHIHCLISLNAEQSIGKVMQMIKGESSFWINKNNIVEGKFEWADEYFSVSVSRSHLNKVREYIKNQEEHHRHKTWEEEYREFMAEYGIVKMGG